MHDYDALFADSYQRVLGSGAFHREFIDAFYERFLGSSEEVASLFSATDMARQKTMLHDSLDLMVDFSRTRRDGERLRELARLHGRSGRAISADLYQSWVDCLLATVRTFDEHYDASVDLAWRMTLAPGVCYMIHASTWSAASIEGGTTA